MSTPSAPAAPPSCYRHPDRATYISCTRCQRYICPDCMRSAAVGHQCPNCVDEGAKSVRKPKRNLGAMPVVTYALVAANVVMFVLQMVVPGLQTALILWPNSIAYLDEYYRLLTSAFLHDGPAHILFNMWALWVVGPPLERWLGRTRFIALYFMSALGGSVLVFLVTDPASGTLGASGAIFGLFAATLVLSRQLNLDMRWIAGLIVVNLVLTFTFPGISWQGHLGGLLTGAALGALYGYAPRAHRMLIEVAASLVLVALCVALVWWRTTSLLTGVG